MVYSRMPLGPPYGPDLLPVLQKLVAEQMQKQQLTTIEECIAFCEAHPYDSGALIAARLRAEADRLRSEADRLREGQ